MQPSATELRELKTATGITDFGAVTYEQFAQVVKKAAENGLSLERLKLLVQVMPQFVQLQSEMIGALKKIAEGAQSGQHAALQAVGNSLDATRQTLHVLAQNAQTDEVRLEIAKIAVEVGKQGLELARIIVVINGDNNSFWRHVAGIAGTAAVVVIGVSLLVFSGGRVNVLQKKDDI